MILEKCIICGGQIIDIVLTSMPPISQKKCSSCGRVVSEEREDIIINVI